MNNTQLIGRMTKDVDMKYTQNGVAVATFTLAVNRPFTNKTETVKLTSFAVRYGANLRKIPHSSAKRGHRLVSPVAFKHVPLKDRMASLCS